MNSYERTVKELQDRIEAVNNFIKVNDNLSDSVDTFQANMIKQRVLFAKQKKKELEEQLDLFERSTPEIEKKLGFIDGPHHVSGRVYSMSDGCFNVLMIFFLIDAIVAFIVLLVTGCL